MSYPRGTVRQSLLCTAVIAVLANALLCLSQVAVTTYHYDNYRTGWNAAELQLTPANVATSFGLLATVQLDDRVDSQPLIMPGVNITAGNFQGIHDVVYVATASDTLYAIDANNGTVLLHQSFGKAVMPPPTCGVNGSTVGVTSTPVIDPASGTLYIMSYTAETTGRTYRIHAIDLGSLTDKVTPVVVSGSHSLSDGTTFSFSAPNERQRPGLLLANGNIYAGFGSYCDADPRVARGWLLGWNAGTLAPLPTGLLLDTQAVSTDGYYMASIWMSGYGLAADDAGNILFVTGNSGRSGTDYDGVTNISESVVKVSPDLSTVLDLFTPSNEANLDEDDLDFGSGGAMVLPDQPGKYPHLAVAAGKLGTMFLMNEDHLGGFNPINHIFGTFNIGQCWCGESYFVDPADGVGRVVSSGGNTVKVWKVQTSTTAPPKLTLATSSPTVVSASTHGFFTSISSNGPSNAIVWALSRPISGTPASVTLYAFDPDSGGTTMNQLFQGSAGVWPHSGGNSNQVPVVANGKVYVASTQLLQIFGLLSSRRRSTRIQATSK